MAQEDWQKNFVLVIVLNIKHAFESIDIRLLLGKLKKIGFFGSDRYRWNETYIFVVYVRHKQ